MAISYLSALDIDSGITTAASSTIAGATFTSGLGMGTNNITLTGYIGRDSGDNIDFGTDAKIHYKLADTNRFIMTSSSLSPFIDSAYDLGATGSRWANLWVDSINGSAPAGGSVTSVGYTHAGNAFTVGGQPITGSGTIAVTMAGTSSQFIDGAGTLTNLSTLPQGDITGVTAGSGLTGGGTSGTVTLNVGAGKLITVDTDVVNVDLTLLNDMTDPWVTGSDEFVVLDGGTAQKRKLSSEIFGSNAFNSSTIYAEPGIFSGGGTPTLASGVTAAEIRFLIGAGTGSGTMSSWDVQTDSGAGAAASVSNGDTVTFTSGNSTLDVTNSGLSASFNLANTAVSAGSYTLASITVDAQGRLTSASSGSSGSGTVTSVATGAGISGGTITSTGTLVLDVEGATTTTTSSNAKWFAIADTAGATYKIAPASIMLSTMDNDSGWTTNTGTVTSVATGTGLSGGTITGTGTITLANTAVTAGSYTSTALTVDAQGRITAASSGSPGDVTGVTASTNNNYLGINVANSSGPVPDVGINIVGQTELSSTPEDDDRLLIYDKSTTTNKYISVVKLMAAGEQGDITGVTAGTGMSGGGTSGTVTLNNAGVTSNLASTGISVSGATGAVTITNTAPNIVQTTITGNSGSTTKLVTARTIASVSFNGTANISLNNNAITNGAGYTTNTGTVTSIATTGGISGGTITGTGTLKLDVEGSTTTTTSSQADWFAIASTAGDTYKIAPGDIDLSTMNNDSGWTTNTGTVTSVGSGDGLSGGAITGSGTLTVDSTVVRTSGTQTIAGAKTFSSVPTIGTTSTVDDSTLAASTAWVKNQGYSTTAGDITGVTAGTGLSGGGTTGTVTLNLANTAVTAGSYTATALTVDAQGRITAASSGSPGDITGVTAGTGLTGGGTSGSVTLDIDYDGSDNLVKAATEATIGNTSSILFNQSDNAYRSLLSDIGLSKFDNDSGFTTNAGTVTSVATGTGLSGGTFTTSGTITLANTAVSAGSYTHTSLTVDAQGRITAASSGSDSAGVTSVATGAGLSGGTITATGTLILDVESSTTTTTSSNADWFSIANTAGTTYKIAPGDIDLSTMNNDSGWTTNSGTVTSVAASASTGISISGSPITTSGTLTITNTAPNIVQTTITGNAGSATVLQTARNIAGVSFNGSANISLNNNAITNGAGYTTNTGDITSVTAREGLTGGGTSGGVTLDVDYAGTDNVILSATNDVGNAVVTGDYIITSNKATDTVEYHTVSDLPFSNNDGDITSVTAGTGMSGGGTSGAVTLNNAGVTSNVASTGISVSGATGAVTITNTSPNIVQTTITGNAGSATKLQTARNIAGVSFNGTANISLNNNAITNGAGYTTATGTMSSWTINSDSGSGTISNGGTMKIAGGTSISTAESGGVVTVTNTSPNIVQTTITGNAGTATLLQTARTISGTSFNGGANITLNNSSITNGAGYTTNTGTTTASNTQTFTNKSGNNSQWTNDSGYVTSSGGSMSSWDLTAEGGAATAITNGETVDFNGGTNITTSRSGATITINNGITNNTQLTNGAGYTTNTGTTTASNSQTFTNKGGNISQWTNNSGYITSYVNTTYTAGSGLSLTGTVFANTAPNIVQTSVTGNAGSATVLKFARTIAGVSFDGSANISLNNSAITNGAGYTTNTGTTTASNTQTFTNKSGNISQWTNNSGYTTATGTMSSWTIKEGNGTESTSVTNGETLTIAQGTGITSEMTSTSSGGTITITNTAPNIVQTTITGNAGSATVLQTARNIAGVSFNGSGNISLNNNAITNGAGYITSYVNTTYTAGTGLLLTGTVFSNTITNNSQLTNGAGYTTNTGDITGVTAGTGMSGGGTSGAVTLNCSITNNNQLTNGAGYTTSTGDITSVTAGTGMSGGGTSGAVTLTNAGVTSIVAGTGINVSGATGGVTVSTEQDIDTGADVQFDSFGVGTAASGTTGMIRATNNIYAYYSDERLKDFEGNIPNALDKVCQLGGYYFRENELAKELGYTNNKRQVGVNAQEVEKILPEVVHVAPISDTEAANGVEYKTVSYDKLVPLLIESIKELKAEIDELKNS